VGWLAEEVGVIGGDEFDEPLGLVIATHGIEQPAVVVETGAAQLPQPIGEPTGHEGLPVGTQPNAAATVDDVGEERVGLWGEVAHADLYATSGLSVTRLGVARAESPDARYSPPGLRSLDASFAYGILPSLAANAGSLGTGNPELNQ
jgi:hypothetical protein